MTARFSTRVAPVLVAAMVLATPAAARATHFILEGSAGVGSTDQGDPSTFYGLTMGYGGRIVGFPPRFYLLMQFSGDFFEHVTPAYVRRVTDFSLLAGPRIYLPLTRHLRIFGQALVGAAWSSAEWTVHGIETYNPTDEAIALNLGAGFQARLARWLSIGVVYERMAYWGKENDLSMPALTGVAGIVDEGDQHRVGGTFTFHF